MNSALILVGLCEHQYLKQTFPPFFLLLLTNVTSDCAAAYLADPPNLYKHLCHSFINQFSEGL